MSSSSDETPVPLVDLKAAHAEVADEVRAGFDRVLDTTAFIMGPDVARFEEEFARFTETNHCIGVSSGTDALELVMRAVGIGPGDEVIVPVNTFIATATAVCRAGATPVFVDCDERHLLIDPERIAPAITERTRAIAPVHLYGQMAPMEAVGRIAAERGLLVIEDCAQAQGAKQNGKSAGTLSVGAGTSFYPGKNLGAYGDAGAVVTNDPDLAQAVRALRNYGSTQKYDHPLVGFNCRLDTFQAVVLCAKLERLAEWNASRRAAAGRYDGLLEGLAGTRIVETLEGNEHVHHLYVVELTNQAIDRTRVLEELHAAGIGAGIHYPAPLHLTGAFESLGYQEGEFPIAEASARRIISLPLFPQITAGQQERVATCLARALEA